jgi:hypothetical protein
MLDHANALFLCPAGVGLLPESRCRVIRSTDTETTVVFGLPLESPALEGLAPQLQQSDADTPDCGNSRPRTISPEQQCLSSFDLQSEPESNDALGTETTKNAAAKGSFPDPVFSGIRAKNDKDFGADQRDRDSQSLGECQNPPPVTSGDMSGLYIGAGLYSNWCRD